MIEIDKDILEKMYVRDGMTMREIAQRLGVSAGCVFNRMKKYEIPSRISMTEKTKQRISIAHIGHSYNKGREVSEETRKKISDAHKGKYIKASRYGGHRKKRVDGYIMVYIPGHPHATKDGYVMEHHVNHIRDDNRIENLRLMTFREHSGLHMKERWEKKKGVMAYQ